MSDDSRGAEPDRPANANATRDHLANERTLLAWVRTCIAIIALGFVVARFGLVIREVGGAAPNQTLRGFSTAFGVALVACGALLVIPATVQYRRTARAIEDNTYQPSFTLAMILAGGSVVAAALLLVYMLVTA
jgi:putative membrane protein